MNVVWMIDLMIRILFLDVLFPLNVSRIIYVDADQVSHQFLFCF